MVPDVGHYRIRRCIVQTDARHRTTCSAEPKQTPSSEPGRMAAQMEFCERGQTKEGIVCPRPLAAYNDVRATGVQGNLDRRGPFSRIHYRNRNGIMMVADLALGNLLGCRNVVSVDIRVDRPPPWLPNLCFHRKIPTNRSFQRFIQRDLTLMFETETCLLTGLPVARVARQKGLISAVERYGGTVWPLSNRPGIASLPRRPRPPAR